MTELADGRVCIFLGQKNYGIWGDFSEKHNFYAKTLTKLHDLTVYVFKQILPPSSDSER
jgi:hypothetical protein